MTATLADPYQDYTPATIAPEDMGRAMRMFATTYNRPVDAAIREIAANALDSQLAAGNANPITISLPTIFDPNLTITDQGLGMSPTEATETFANFISSSKREDLDAMGVYGIGAKAPFAVAQQYYLTAIKDGVKCYLRFVLTESGVPVHKVLSIENTNEPNGVSLTIPIPVPANDHGYSYWVQCAQRVLYWWEPGTVVVTSHPESKFPSFREDINEQWSTDEVLFLHSKHGAHMGLGRSMVRMGSIAYEISSAVPMHRIYDGEYVIQAPIKSYEVTATREGVADNDLAREQIQTAVDQWRNTMMDRYRPQLETAKTSFDLCVIWGQMPEEIRQRIAHSPHLALMKYALPSSVEVISAQFIGAKPRKKGWRLSIEDFEHLEGALFLDYKGCDKASPRVIQEWRRANKRRTIFVISDPSKLVPFIDPETLQWTTIAELKAGTPVRARVTIPVDQIMLNRITNYTHRYYERQTFHSQDMLLKDIKALLEAGLPLVIGSREEIEEVAYTSKTLLANAVVITRGARTAANTAKLLGSTYFTPQSHLEHLRSLKVAALSMEERQLIVDRADLSDTVVSRAAYWQKHSATTKAQKALIEPVVALKNTPRDEFLAKDPAMPTTRLAQQMPLLIALLKCANDPDSNVVIALATLDNQNAARAARKRAKR